MQRASDDQAARNMLAAIFKRIAEKNQQVCVRGGGGGGFAGAACLVQLWAQKNI